MSAAVLFFKNEYVPRLLTWRGWTAWHETWADRAAALARMLLSMNHLLSRSLSCGFGVWMQMVAVRRELSRSWVAWVKMREDRNNLMRKLRRASLGARLKEMYFVNRKLARGWVAWRRWLVVLEPMVRALRYSMKRSLVRGWAEWLSTWEAAEANRELIFINFELARGWAQWRSVWKAVKENCEMTRKSHRHVLSRSLSRGLGAWSKAAIELQELVQKLREGLIVMTNRRLALGFGGWRAALAPRGDPMSKVLPYLSNRLVARGLTAWLWNREELMAKRGAMRKSLVAHLHVHMWHTSTCTA